jgi:hypothetical protein
MFFVIPDDGQGIRTQSQAEMSFQRLVSGFYTLDEETRQEFMYRILRVNKRGMHIGYWWASQKERNH